MKHHKKGAIARYADGLKYAGTHLFVDMWQDENVADEEAIVNAIKIAVVDSHATLLKLESSSFGEHQGVTAFAILAESHICINTWSEEGMVAIDIFFCAGLNPYLCLPALRRVFNLGNIQVSEHKRLLQIKS